MEYLVICLLDLPDKLSTFLVIAASAFLLASFIEIVTCFDDFNGFVENETNKCMTKIWKGVTVAFIIASFLYAFCPKKETFYLLAGTYLGKQMIKSETVTTKINKVSKIIDLELDKYLIKLKKKDLK